jgi:hypothetical protein
MDKKRNLAMIDKPLFKASDTWGTLSVVGAWELNNRIWWHCPEKESLVLRTRVQSEYRGQQSTKPVETAGESATQLSTSQALTPHS